MIYNIIAASGSKEKIVELFQQVIRGLRSGLSPTHYIPMYYTVGDTVLELNVWDEKTVKEVLGQLDQREGTPLSSEGDKFVIDENGNLLIKVAPRPDRAAVNVLLKPAFTPPVDTVSLVHMGFASLGTAWQQAK